MRTTVGRLTKLAILAGTLALLCVSSATAATNSIFTVAGTGPNCSPTTAACGDTGAATAAQLNVPFGVAATPDGGFLIADTGNHPVRRVAPKGPMTTAAGTATGLSPGGGPPP